MHEKYGMVGGEKPLIYSKSTLSLIADWCEESDLVRHVSEKLHKAYFNIKSLQNTSFGERNKMVIRRSNTLVSQNQPIKCSDGAQQKYKCVSETTAYILGENFIVSELLK